MGRILAVLILLWLAGCQGTPIQPMVSHADRRDLTAEERRLWYAAGEIDAQLEKADTLYEDAALQEYLETVMQRLYPEYRGAITVRIIDSPALNAFALPNGSIYINTGMLTRLQNEAQMATVLAHEGVHFTHKHSWKQRRNIKSSTAFSTGFGVLTGIQGVGDLIAISSIYGFSKDLEREADVEGFKRLQAAGYDVSQAPLTFEFLLAEVDALEIDEPYFFSTHPRLQERIDSFGELAEQQGPATGNRGEQSYLEQVAGLQLKLLQDYLEVGQYQSVLLILEDPDAFTRYPAPARFYLGEAYRLRGAEGDVENAARAYRVTLEQAPDFAPTYRALGLHYMKNAEPEPAEYYFQRYLELAPGAPDRGYIEYYRSTLQPQGSH